MAYREFNCVVCGKKAIDRSPSHSRLTCSVECADMKYRRDHGIGLNQRTFSCIYNEGVTCDRHKCNTCGWNPTVERKRTEALYGA